MIEAGELSHAEQQRLRWRCRRGMLETDLILARFVDAGYLQLSRDEQLLFDDLLELPDTLLWDMLTGRLAGDTTEHEALLQKLRLA